MTTATEPGVQNKFTLFPVLPAEIRSQIWRHAITPRIIKWARKHGENIFTGPSKKPFLFDVCPESHEAALLYGQYKDISTTSTPVYFSVLVDYLIFDPGWRDFIPHFNDFTPPPNVEPFHPDPLDTLPQGLLNVRNIMVHPNYTDKQKFPTALFEKLLHLEQLLVVGDEKSMGFQSKYMVATIYDITKYYETQKRQTPNLKIPPIAIGCLGWTGVERRKIHHTFEDDRELVAIFENEAEMKGHLNMLREEEWKFTQQLKLTRPKFTLKLKNPEGEGPYSQLLSKSTPNYQEIPSPPPAYSHASSGSQRESDGDLVTPQPVVHSFLKRFGVRKMRAKGL